MRNRERIPIHDHSDLDTGGFVAGSTVVTQVSGSSTTTVVTGATTADAISITDAGAYFTGTTVEAALQEVGATAAAAVTTLDGLSDVDTTGVADGDVLAYDIGTTTWVPVTATGGSGNVSTDAIWDTAGDLAVGTGANTAAKLAIGNAGGHLAVYNGAVIWDAGTSFPASPDTGDRYWRSDRNLEYVYDGTQWLTTTLYVSNFGMADTTYSTTTTSTVSHRAAAFVDSDMWLEEYHIIMAVATTNSGSAYWSAALRKITQTGTVTTVATLTTAAQSANDRVKQKATIGALAGTSNTFFDVLQTKTGTPGALTASAFITYRLVG